jgi:hypothetical protein
MYLPTIKEGPAAALIRDIKAMEKQDAFDHRNDSPGNPTAGTVLTGSRPSDLAWYSGSPTNSPMKPAA